MSFVNVRGKADDATNAYLEVQPGIYRIGDAPGRLIDATRDKGSSMGLGDERSIHATGKLGMRE